MVKVNALLACLVRPLRRRPALFSYLIFVLAGVIWAPFPSPQIDGDAILNHLNAAIGWYRNLSAADGASGQPSDILYLQNARELAHQALQLAFESAEAEAALQQSPAFAENQTSGAESSSEGQRLAKSLADANDHTRQLESQIEALNKQIESAHGKKRQDLISQRDAQQGALDLNKALQDALQKISSSVNTTGGNKSELQKDINQSKQSVPEVFAAKPPSQPKGRHRRLPQRSRAPRFWTGRPTVDLVRRMCDLTILTSSSRRRRIWWNWPPIFALHWLTHCGRSSSRGKTR